MGCFEFAEKKSTIARVLPGPSGLWSKVFQANCEELQDVGMWYINLVRKRAIT